MSIDRREDAGDFYPGGKVISTRPVATGGDVKHSDFAGLDVKTNTIPDLRDAVRELGRRLGATVVTALAACVAIAATVQTVPVNDLDFDANPSIVTNVVFDAPPDYSTNNTALVATIEATAPAPGDYAAVSNAAVYAAITNALQDVAIESNRVNIASNRVAISTLNDTKLDKSGGTVTGGIYFGAQGTYGYLGLVYDGENHRLIITDGWHENLAYLEVPNAYDGDRVAFTHDIPTVPTNVSAFNNDAGYLTGYTESDPTVPQWAKASTKPTYTAAEVGAVSTAGGTLTGPLTLTRGIAAGGDDMFYGDGMKNLDNNAVYAWPTKSGMHHFALTSDIPDVPAWALAAQKPTYTADEVGAASPEAVSNIVSTAYVREKLGVWMEYDEATGFYYYCHEEE